MNIAIFKSGFISPNFASNKAFLRGVSLAPAVYKLNVRYSSNKRNQVTYMCVRERERTLGHSFTLATIISLVVVCRKWTAFQVIWLWTPSWMVSLVHICSQSLLQCPNGYAVSMVPGTDWVYSLINLTTWHVFPFCNWGWCLQGSAFCCLNVS